MNRSIVVDGYIPSKLVKLTNLALRLLGVLLLLELAFRVGSYVVRQLVEHVMAGSSHGVIPVFVGLAVVNCMFMIFEAYEDRSKLSAKRFAASYGRGIVFTFMFYCLAAPGHALAGNLIELGWLVPLVAPEDFTPFIVVYPLLFLLVQDFFYYWLHYFMHKFPALWRFHAIHHSLEELTSWNGYHHWFEEYLRLFLVLIPTVIILQPPPQDIFLLSAVVYAWGSYLHTSARCLALPAPLRAYMADNVYHHYHHAIAPEHHDKNFAAYFPLWDRLFGTQYLPQGDELPKIGIAGEVSAQSPLDYLCRPFAKRD